MSEVVTDIAKTALGVIAGTVVSMVITGFLVNRFVIKKVMANKDVQDLIRLFRESKGKLEELLEVQKKNGTKA